MASTLSVRSARLHKLFCPESVAVVGASDDPRTFTGATISNLRLHNFRGRVYPVNPRRQEVQGLKCWPSISDLPELPDTAVIVVPGPIVRSAVSEAIAAGVPSLQVIAAGVDDDGSDPEGIRSMVSAAGVAMLGPNTAGMVNLLDDYVPRAGRNHLPPDLLKPGSVAIVCQSGACSNMVFNRAQANGVGVGYVVATGDQADLDIWETVEHLSSDPRIDTVLSVVEDMSDVPRFAQAVQVAAEQGVSIVLLKLGQSLAGGAAVAAHSASVAGDARIQKAACRQMGVGWVSDFDELWEAAALLQAWGRPASEPIRLGVYSVSGGEGALIADVAAEHGIGLAEMEDGFAGFVKAEFSFAHPANPFDPTGEIVGKPELMATGLAAFDRFSSATHLIVSTASFRDDMAERICGGFQDGLPAVHTPVLATYWDVPGLTGTQRRILSGAGVPVVPNSARAVRAMQLWYSMGAKAGYSPQATRSLPGNTGPRSYSEIRSELAALGVPFPPSVESVGLPDPHGDLARLRFPVVVKANVDSATHKSASGLVRLNIRSGQQLLEVSQEVLAAAEMFGSRSLIVEEQVGGDLQAIVGIVNDQYVGRTLVVGSGGSAVEALDDTTVSLLDLGRSEPFVEVISRTRLGHHLSLRAPKAIEELSRVASQLVAFSDAHAFSALELNPISIDSQSGTVTCLDARLTP